jgi:hypothetical protein
MFPERLTAEWFRMIRAQAVSADDGWRYFCAGFREVTGRDPGVNYRRMVAGVAHNRQAIDIKMLQAGDDFELEIDGDDVRVLASGDSDGWGDL